MKMSCLKGAVVVAGVLLGMAFSNEAVAAEAPPNIVFILLDDMGWDEPGCYGARTKLETPNIDRLAREGMRFTHLTSYPYCSPSRAAFISGRHGFRTGIISNVADPGGLGRELRASEIPVPKGLKRTGYETAVFGKLHLHWDNAVRPEFAHERLGFDESFIYLGVPWAEMEKAPGAGAKIGRPAGGMVADHFNTPWHRNGKPVPKIEGYNSDIMTREAIEYIRKPHDKPFLVWMPYFAIHEPFQSPERWQMKWNARREELRPVLDECVQRTRAFARAGSFSGKGLLNYNPPLDMMVNRAAMVSTVDENIGWILDALDEAGVADNTLVVFSSDNGPHPIAGGGKANMVDAGLREPLIVRWPAQIAPGTVCDALAESVDIYPTLMEAAGAKMPEEITFDGLSLLPWLSGRKPAEWREFGVSALKGSFGIFNHDWFMRDTPNKEPQFFARSTPPTPLEKEVDAEMVPIAVRKQMKAEAARLRAIQNQTAKEIRRAQDGQYTQRLEESRKTK
jgi:arylsulfatase A-like enzyme